MTVYLRVFGLAVDEDGNKNYAGVKINIDTDEITDEKKDNIIEFFTKLFPVCNGKVELISEDEYITLYGDEWKRGVIFMLGFIIGIIIGATFGAMIMALAAASGRSDRKKCRY